MTKLLPAIYEHGSFKTIQSLRLPEHSKVLLAVIITQDEIPSLLISKLAENSASYEFLNSPAEDIYSINDGEQI